MTEFEANNNHLSLHSSTMKPHRIEQCDKDIIVVALGRRVASSGMMARTHSMGVEGEVGD